MKNKIGKIKYNVLQPDDMGNLRVFLNLIRFLKNILLPINVFKKIILFFSSCIHEILECKLY